MGSASSKEERALAQGLNNNKVLFTKNLFSSFGSITTTNCDAPPPPAPPPLPAGAGDTGVVPPPPPPAATDGDSSIAEAAKMASAYMNPGPYEQAMMASKQLVSLDVYDGFRCDINKQLSPFMGVIHNFWLGTNSIPDGRKRTYAFIAQVADENGLMMARVDPDRVSVDGRIHRALLGGAALSKTQFGVSQDGNTDQLLTELDFGAQTWSGNLKYGSMGGGTIYGCNYFQAITPRLAMGGEGMYISSNQNLVSNYFLKYTMPASTGEEDSEISKAAASSSKSQDPNMPPLETEGSSTFFLNFNTGQAMLGLNYKRVVTPNRVSVGADLQCNPFTLQSELLVGAEFKLTRSRVHLCVDGNGKVQSVVEAKLGMVAGSPQLNFSAEVDHANDDMKFGYGINFEG